MGFNSGGGPRGETFLDPHRSGKRGCSAAPTSAPYEGPCVGQSWQTSPLIVIVIITIEDAGAYL